LGQHVMLIWVMVKAVAARHGIKIVVRKWQMFAVGLHKANLAALDGIASRGSPEHPGTQIEAPDFCVRNMAEHGCCEPTRAAADVKNATIGKLERIQEHAMRRPKEQRLERVPIIAPAPLIELLAGVGRTIIHSRKPPNTRRSRIVEGERRVPWH